MLTSNNTYAFDKITYVRLSFLLSGRYWQFKVVLFCVLTTLFFSLPSYDRFFSDQDDYHRIWNAIARQIEHPLTPVNYDKKDHAAKIAFRLLPALIGKIAPFNNYFHKVIFIFVVQQLAGFLFFLILVKWAYRLTADSVISFLFTYGIVFVYIGRSFFYELYPFFDGLAFLLMTLSIYVRARWLSFFVLFLSYWVDERAIIASALIFLYKLTEDRSSNLVSVKHFCKNVGVYIPYFAFLSLYVIIHVFLEKGHNLKVPIGDNADAGVSVIYKQIIHLPLAIFLTYEGYWCLLVWLLVHCIFTNNITYSMLIGFFFLIILFVSCCVWDVTRSLCYALPILLIAFRELILYSNTIFVRNIMMIVLLVNFLIPTYKYHFHNFFWQVPAFMKLIYHWMYLYR